MGAVSGKDEDATSRSSLKKGPFSLRSVLNDDEEGDGVEKAFVSPL